MTVLRLVVDPVQHDRRAREIYEAARVALLEMHAAITASDPHGLIAAERRLLAAGNLAGSHARTLERSMNDAC